jgi:hypothetical protein
MTEEEPEKEVTTMLQSHLYTHWRTLEARQPSKFTSITPAVVYLAGIIEAHDTGVVWNDVYEVLIRAHHYLPNVPVRGFLELDDNLIRFLAAKHGLLQGVDDRIPVVKLDANVLLLRWIARNIMCFPLSSAEATSIAALIEEHDTRSVGQVVSQAKKMRGAAPPVYMFDVVSPILSTESSYEAQVLSKLVEDHLTEIQKLKQLHTRVGSMRIV